MTGRLQGPLRSCSSVDACPTRPVQASLLRRIPILGRQPLHALAAALVHVALTGANRSRDNARLSAASLACGRQPPAAAATSFAGARVAAGSESPGGSAWLAGHREAGTA